MDYIWADNDDDCDDGFVLMMMILHTDECGTGDNDGCFKSVMMLIVWIGLIMVMILHTEECDTDDNDGCFKSVMMMKMMIIVWIV